MQDRNSTCIWHVFNAPGAINSPVPPVSPREAGLRPRARGRGAEAPRGEILSAPLQCAIDLRARVRELSCMALV
jgi:hypothetical protein